MNSLELTDVETKVRHNLKFSRKNNIKPSNLNALSIDNSILEKYGNDIRLRWCDLNVARQQELEHLGYISITGTDVGIDNTVLRPERQVDRTTEHRQILMAVPKEYDQMNQDLISSRGKMTLKNPVDDPELAVKGYVKSMGGLVSKKDIFEE